MVEDEEEEEDLDFLEGLSSDQSDDEAPSDGGSDGDGSESEDDFV